MNILRKLSWTKPKKETMLEAVGCRIFYLRRISIDRLYFDTSLKEGEFRSLTSEETELI